MQVFKEIFNDSALKFHKTRKMILKKALEAEKASHRYLPHISHAADPLDNDIVMLNNML